MMKKVEPAIKYNNNFFSFGVLGKISSELGRIVCFFDPKISKAELSELRLYKVKPNMIEWL